MDAELLQKLKNTELEILLSINDFCYTNNIESKYRPSIGALIQAL